MAEALAQQMNVRIDSHLKEEGDRIFASIGLSPSQAVRALYTAAAKHRYDTSALKEFLLSENTDESPEKDSVNPRISITREGRATMQKFIQELQISKQALAQCAALSDEELLEEAFVERMTEREII